VIQVILSELDQSTGGIVRLDCLASTCIVYLLKFIYSTFFEVLNILRGSSRLFARHCFWPFFLEILLIVADINPDTRGQMSVVKSGSHFSVVQHFESDFSPHKFTEYVSSRTGMRVVIVDQEGPKVHGYFALATEIHDDSGAPHTLEHLVFMGSKKYPYKGLLDKVATRGYSTTNAWTANDHTAYTLETAGGKAFLTVLPVYLDHVVRPTLTDAGCYTEVYHIDGSGHDAGVVYSEMQGVENTQQSIMDLQTNRMLYPDGNGFRYETGGLMGALRVLSADRIRSFHKEMYQPKNLCLVLCGKLDHKELFTILDDFEGTILHDVPAISAPFKRPWVESKQTPPIKKSIVETSLFPEEDESQGEILITYLGPSCNDTIEATAMTSLLMYLAGSSASVLENVIVEREQLASAVYFFTTDRPDIVVQFILSGVESSKLEEASNRFFALVKETAAKELNMVYMRAIVAREKRGQKAAAEDSTSFFSGGVITYFLFDKHGKESTLKDLGTLKDLEVLETWSDRQWRDFLERWLGNANSITLHGKPSAALSKKLKEDEEVRVKKRKEALGEKGLKELDGKLEHAKAENSKEVPKEMLRQHTVADPGINFINTTTARAGLAKDRKSEGNSIQKLIDRDHAKFPLYLHYEHVPSNFVRISLLVSTSGIPIALRPLTIIFTELFFSLPIMRDGKKIAFDDVIMELERDTVDFSIESAGSLATNEMFAVSIKTDREKYGIAIGWLRVMMRDTIFDVERIESAIAKYLADVPDEKRSGDQVSIVR